MTVLRIACLLVFAFAVSGLASAVDESKSMPKDVPDFDVHGISMTECQCTAYACPCRSNGHPDHGSCDAADFTYIKHGHYGKVDLSGFKAVVIGDLIDHDASKVQSTAYFDKMVFKYNDKGVGEWDLSGHQDNVKEFHTTKEMYANKKLLMQHGDMSGTWTAEQKKMIEEMGMKPE